MQIVPVDQIPKLEDIVDVPMDDPIAVYKVCLEMAELCRKSEGVGLAAVQVGIPWKLFVVRSFLNHLYLKQDIVSYFVNCEYTPKTEETFTSLEGCLSIRSEEGLLRHFEVARHKDIILDGHRLYDNGPLRFEKIENIEIGSPQCVVYQHEIDHQNSILISDIGREVFIWGRGNSA